jgi:hypothetical protein
MSSYHLTDEHERELLHHLLGLDSFDELGRFRCMDGRSM